MKKAGRWLKLFRKKLFAGWVAVGAIWLEEEELNRKKKKAVAGSSHGLSEAAQAAKLRRFYCFWDGCWDVLVFFCF